MKEMLEYLFDNQTLSKVDAKSILKEIATGLYNNSQMAAFLSVFRLRGLTVDELDGFRAAMLELCIRVDLSEFDPLDIVGTGGDGKNTFNISTLSAFIVAGSGLKVAKHGNYGVSSACGSSNVLEALGVSLSGEVDTLKQNLDRVGICFLHAPLFHPAMKNVAPVRRELGVKTFFNILGPLVNPATPRYQLLGVYNLEFARLYSYLLQRGETSFMIVHSLDGYDEVSLTGPVKIISGTKEQIFEPTDFGFDKVKEEELQQGSSVESATAVFRSILEGQGTKAQNQVVIANAGLAIQCAKPKKELSACFQMARESLESGAALKVLKKLIK
ncbi:anthranilate phosphoribosyltransferase [Oligoflexia bacterium]|nr:anthranilate phosphoribosyltransferase [Oligoflexia bacterium]